MYSKEIEIRVRYGETDKMGYVYYGNYALYYEVARTFLMETAGLNYKELEKEGIILPVISLKSKYIAPAFYYELLTIKASLIELPNIRIKFFYDIFNEDKKLINQGETEHVFVNAETRKPIKVPEFFIENIQKYFL